MSAERADADDRGSNRTDEHGPVPGEYLDEARAAWPGRE
jgi:hypothetical protein